MPSPSFDSESPLAAGSPEMVAEQMPTPPSPQRPQHTSMVYLVGALAGGNLLSSIFRLAGGLMQARYVNPAALGTFVSIGLALGWSRFCQLGIFNGLNRELPYYYGKGDYQRAGELAATGRAWAMLLGMLVGGAFLLMSALSELQGQRELAIGWSAHAALAFFFFYGTLFLQATYRTAHDFARLSTATVVQNAVGLVLVALVYWYGFNGICLRVVLSGLAAVLILQYWQPIRTPADWRFRQLWHLLVIGFPIFIVGELGSTVWLLVDNTLVSVYLKKEGLGLYSMVGVARDTLEILPLAVGQVMYPRMTEHYGRTHDLLSTMTMAIRPSIYLVAGMIPIVVAGWFLAAPMTKLLLPKYIAAVPSMQWSLLLPLVLSFACVHNVYNICRQQVLYAVVILLSMGSYAGTLMWLCRSGAYLEAFPQSLLVGRIVFVLAGYLFLVPLYWSWRKRQAATGEIAL